MLLGGAIYHNIQNSQPASRLVRLFLYWVTICEHMYIYWLQNVQCFPEWQWISKCNGRWASDCTWILHTSDSRSHHNLHVRRKERDHLHHWGWQWWKNYLCFSLCQVLYPRRYKNQSLFYINTDQVLLYPMPMKPSSNSKCKVINASPKLMLNK